MFTGLVIAVGTVRSVRRTARGQRLTIAAPLRGLVVGESIAVSGVCLTVVAKGRGTFDVETIATTRGRTLTGEWRAGTALNLERALRLGDRLGGHLVSGHVDGVGTLAAAEKRDDALLLDIAVPPDVAAVTVPRGSIAVDGVSLTVNDIPRPGMVQVAIIAHTRDATTLGRLGVGDRVHLEADQIGKLVRQLLQPYLEKR